MTIQLKRLVGALTHWPPLYMVLFMAFWLAGWLGMTGMASAGVNPGPGFGVAFGTVFMVIGVLHVFTMLSMLGLLAAYIVMVVQDEALDSNEKVMWAIFVVMGGFIGQLAYWHLQVRPNLYGLEA